MSRKVKTYDSEFKKDAVDYVEKHPELSVQSVAEMLGIPKETLYGWIKAKRRKDLAGENVPRKGNLTEKRVLYRRKHSNQIYERNGDSCLLGEAIYYYNT